MSSLSQVRIEEMVKNRRILHSFPELQYKEEKTADFIKSHLKDLGFTFEEKIAKTGIVCLLDSEKPGKTVMVRADMDALPIEEENTIPYRSKIPGVMHACGHDGHTSILMGLASELKEDFQSIIPKGRVLLVFQPAEEGGAGADKMIEAGILEKYDISAAFGLHVWNHIDIGKVGVVDGTMMASVDEFELIIKGVSGHGAMPQHTIDPVVVSAHLVTALQTIVSRNFDPFEPCVVTVGSIHAGEAFNVIPETAKMKGTIRTFSETVYNSIPEKFKSLVKGIVAAFGAEVEIRYNRVDKPTINDPEMAEIVRISAKEVLGETCLANEEVKTMGGEDFSAFLMKVPGCYFFIGSRNSEKGFIYPHHSSHFDFDEKALENGLNVMKRVVYNYLKE